MSGSEPLWRDNKAIKTRDGEPIKLIDLLSDNQRASEMVKEKIPSWNRKKFKEASIIGIGAVKYADLSQDRTWTIFSPGKKMLAMQEIPPLTYNMRLRIHSIFKKSMVYRRIESKKPAHRNRQTKIDKTLFPLAIEQAARS